MRVFRLVFRDTGPRRERLQAADDDLTLARRENARAGRRNKAAIETLMEEVMKEVRR